MERQMTEAKLVTIYGGSGFLGRQITRILAAEGWRVRVAVRRPYLAGLVRTYGAPGQVEPVFCNVRDDQSVRTAMADADAVINCVGIMNRQGRNTFSAVNEEAAARIARITAEVGIPRLTHVSALGADPRSNSDYAATKGRGESAVLREFPNAVILRPSILFGSDDTFYNRIASMARFGPIMVIPGAKTRVQPVYVMDVAQVAARSVVDPDLEAGIYELAGPEAMTMRELAQQVLTTIDRRRLIIGLPSWMASIAGGMFDMCQTMTGGLITNRLLTRDQVRTLRYDNVPSGAERVRTFTDLGISPVASGAVIPEYLWRFRPMGQYEAILDSAKQLRRN